MAKKAKVDPVIVDVRPDDEEAALAIIEGGAVSAFVAGLREFFSTARSLEKAAVQTQLEARSWKKPTTLEEDTRLVEQVRAVNARRKEIDEHWSITSKVHQFHRRLTAARDRGAKALEDASSIGNRLHAQYAEEELRRAREEEERRRRAEEERQRLDQEREAQRLEAEAIRLESESEGLSEREQRFLAAYLRTDRAVYAARDAGYRNPDQAATRLLATKKIATAIEAARAAERLRQQATAKRDEPVESVFVPESKPEVAKGAAQSWSAEVFDVGVFLAALLDPVQRTRYGIPVDVAAFDQKRLNEYARALQENIGRWPGVRAKKGSSIR